MTDRTPTGVELTELVERALAEARVAGASAADVGISVETGLSVTVRLGEVESLEHHRNRGMGITAYVGQRKGSASTGDLSWSAIADTVRKAVSIARFTAEDPYAGLPDPADLVTDIPDLELSHPWSIDAPHAIEIARSCESAALGVDARITNSEGASVSAQSAERVFGNTHGLIAGYPSSYASISCVVMGQAGDQQERDYWYSTSRDPAALEEPEAIGRRAAQRTVARLGARRVATTRAPVLYVPELARGLLGHFLGAIRGGAQYRRSSFLLDAAGTAIFPRFFAISERPHLKRGLGSAPFDSEGCRTRDRELVREGVLDGYVLDSYSARKLGLRATGNAGGVHNLIVHPGAADFAGLLRQMGRGLVVTELMGQGVNPVTGDYSRGAAGFWVEDGAIQYPVNEVTIAGNLREMYRDLVAVGTDVDRRGTVQTGSILVAEMTIAGE
jgi:PmbA protein